MVRKFIKQRNCVRVFHMIIFSFLLVSSCSPHKSYLLEYFEVTSTQLDSCLNLVLKKYFVKDTEQKILVLDFVHSYPGIRIVFSSQDRCRLRNKYIEYTNKRIIGYTIKHNRDIILLTNIDSIDRLKDISEKMIKPTGSIKNFSFLSRPKEIYYDNETSGWKNFESIYEPLLIEFQLKDGKIFGPFARM